MKKYKKFNGANVEPLSNTDIINKLKKHNLNVKFIAYKDLKYLHSLDDIIYPNGCILLYQLHFPIGHWISLFKNNEGTIEYFDPLGFVPDQLIKTNFSHPEGREKMNADFTYLNQLLLEWLEDNGKDKIVYNEYKIQPINSNTCGYQCATRLYFSDIPLDEYAKYFMKMPVDVRERKIVNFFNKL